MSIKKDLRGPCLPRKNKHGPSPSLMRENQYATDSLAAKTKFELVVIFFPSF